MSAELPRRVVRVDFGARRPTLSYVARADVIARFATALRKWNPDYRIEVEPVQSREFPELPYWQLFAWDERRAT